MSNRERELRQERMKLATDMRAQLDKAQAEKRALNDAEKTEDEKRWARIEELDDLIKREERLAEIERSAPPVDNNGAPPTPPKEDRKNPYASPEYRTWFQQYLKGGMAETPQEFRDLQAGLDTAGGYTRPPQQFITDLIKNVDDLVVFRQLATKYQVTQAESLGVPTLAADPADADWTTELLTGSADTAMAFGKRELRPHPFAKQLIVSNTLLRVSALDIEGLIRNRLAFKASVTEEKAFMTGDGINKPLGIFTASANGISTSRDVSTGNLATSIQTDGLIEALHSLKAQYQMAPNLRWIFHRDAVKQIRKLKDGNGQYLWAPSIAGGVPSMILDKPYTTSEYAPNTFTTGLYVGIIGDFSNYWIVDALSYQIQRLVELRALTNQTVFVLRQELDGQPVLEEAFARVKLA